MESSFFKSIEKERDIINRNITKLFDEAIASEEEPFLRQFFTYGKDFVLRGGRRLLPITLIKTFMGISSDKDIVEYIDEIYRLSISIELLHVSALIVDDFIDQETLRSGNPTFHKYITQNIPNEVKAPKELIGQYEESAAIYGGMMTSFLGSQVIAKSFLNLERKAKASLLYYEGLQGINRGHLLDDYYRLIPMENISLENYLILAGLKRGKQMETAVAMGATLANARESQIQPLMEALNKIGVIDQLINDYSGTFGDPNKKSTDNDIKQGNRTILTIIAFQSANDKQKATMNSIIGNADASSSDIDSVKDIFKGTGAVDFVKFYANSLKNDAFNAIQKVYPGVRKETQQFYEDLMGYIIGQAL